jgi:GH15 family glucan-1,4-alpha-glucosidase
MSHSDALPIEDYALIGDCLTAALVGRNGTIDWLCLPRFDSPACFAALLGTPENGRWRIAPVDPNPRVTRSYRDTTMVLDTVFETGDGAATITDFMPVGHNFSSVIRVVRGLRGRVAMQMQFSLRFDYGISIPWVTRLPDHQGIVAIVGPDMVILRCGVPLHGRDMMTIANFDVAAGDSVAFVMSHGPSHLEPPPALDAVAELATTEAFWSHWSDRSKLRASLRGAYPVNHKYSEPMRRSLVTLKALT